MRLSGDGPNGEGGQVGDLLRWVGVAENLHGYNGNDLQLMRSTDYE